MRDARHRGVLLKTGDPDCGPASYTRFILPFQWSDAPSSSGSGAVYEEYKPPREEWRRSYFTPETARVLFDRATWLRLAAKPGAALPPKTGGRVKLHLGDRAIDVVLSPPQVVLFESKAADRDRGTAEWKRNAETGFLLLDLHFANDGDSDEPTFYDLLAINELFRYWRQPFEKHPRLEFEMPGGEKYSYPALLRELIGIPSSAEAALHAYFDHWSTLLAYPRKTTEGSLRTIVSDNSFCEARDWVRTNGGRSGTGWIVFSDERAFVWSCALTENGASDLQELCRRDPTASGDWVRFLNVDRPGRSAATEFERAWVQERTYERWKHFGTLYGFNVHAGVMIGQPIDEPETWRHFRELYFDQTLLLLYLRVSLFRFRARLERISEDMTARTRSNYDEFRDLRKSFVFVTNLYRYPLLSSQQQGIEMYTMTRRVLDVDELFRHVNDEIETTHEMYELVSTKDIADVTAALTWLAAVAGIMAVVMAFLATSSAAKGPVLCALDHLPFLVPEWWLILISFGIALFFGWKLTGLLRYGRRLWRRAMSALKG